jgi:hypothetical protein
VDVDIDHGASYGKTLFLGRFGAKKILRLA